MPKKLEYIGDDQICHIGNYLNARDLTFFSSTCKNNYTLLKEAAIQQRATELVTSITANHMATVFYYSGTAYFCGSLPVKINDDRNQSSRIFTRYLNDKKTKKLVIRDDHMAVLTSEGKLLTTGKNDNGELGHSNNADNNKLSRVTLPFNILDVQLGLECTVVITKDKQLWATGQLGPNEYTHFTAIQHDFKKEDIKQWSIRHQHLAVCTKQGRVWVMGKNIFGELGIEGITQSITFKEITALKEKAVKVITGPCTTLILTEKGNVWVCGHNAFGALGLGDTANRNSIEKVNLPYKIKDIATGGHYSALLTDTGQLLISGELFINQLTPLTPKNFKVYSLNQDIDKITHITAGSHHIIVTTEQNQVFGLGSNLHGSLGMGDTFEHLEFVQLNDSMDAAMEKSENRKRCSIS